MWFGTSGQVVSRCLVEEDSQPATPQRRLAYCPCIVVPVGEYCRSRRLNRRSVISFAMRSHDSGRETRLHNPLRPAELRHTSIEAFSLLPWSPACTLALPCLPELCNWLKFLLCRSRSNLMTVNALGKSLNCRRREARSLVSAAEV